MKTIYVMRHGHTVLDVDKRSDGWLDMPLSDTGLESLIEAQQYLKMVPLTKIITSDLKRTKQTAELIESGMISDPKVAVSSERSPHLEPRRDCRHEEAVRAPRGSAADR